MSIEHTYGEILPESMAKILQILPLTSQDIFLDLGSGVGKIVMQVFQESPVKEACGIEIIENLHQQAVQSAKQLSKDPLRNLTFLSGNFLTTPLPQATCVLIGSPCFSVNSLNKVSDIIENMTSIHTVISLRPLCKLRRLPLAKILRVECSWDSGLCYFFSRLLKSN